MLLGYTNTDFEDVLYHEGDGKSVSLAIFSLQHFFHATNVCGTV